MNKSPSFGTTVREIRESKNLLLRHVAAALDVDTAFVSKLERGEKKATKEQVKKLSIFLDTPEENLLELWLAEKILSAIEGEEHAEQALKIATKRIKNKG